jgi:flagellar biosynthesis/type III secretory pathway protein FliH
MAAVFPELVRRSGAMVGAHASDRAETALERAERQAQALMESARRKASVLMDEARRDGLLQGRAEALADAQATLRTLTESLVAARDRLHALETEFRGRCDALVVDLALAVAERILGAEVARDPEVTLRTVKTALMSLPAPDHVVVRVHPAAAELLQAHRQALQDVAPDRPGLRVTGDPAVAPGGCVVETPHSVVDATFSAQLGEARRRLLEIPW